MKKIFIIFLLLISNSIFAELSGNAKDKWEKSYIPACIKMQTQSSYNKNMSQTDIKKYCHCVSDHIVERATINDVNTGTEKMAKIVNDASILCSGKFILEK